LCGSVCCREVLFGDAALLDGRIKYLIWFGFDGRIKYLIGVSGVFISLLRDNIFL
jgi:hypothetical protein